MKAIFPIVENKKIIIKDDYARFELDMNEAMRVSEAYQAMSTAIYISENYNKELNNELYNISQEIREIMDCNGVTEDEAIDMYREQVEDFIEE